MLMFESNLFFLTIYHITLVCLKWSQRHQIATFKQYPLVFAAVESCYHFSLAVCLSFIHITYVHAACIWSHWEMPACWKIRKLVKIQKGFGALRVANALNATNSPCRDMLSCIFSNPFEDTGPLKNKTKSKTEHVFQSKMVVILCRVLNSDAANQSRHMRPWSQRKPCLGRRRHSILSSLGKSMMKQQLILVVKTVPRKGTTWEWRRSTSRAALVMVPHVCDIPIFSCTYIHVSPTSCYNNG